MLIASVISSALTSCSLLNVPAAVDCRGEIVGQAHSSDMQDSFGREWVKVQDYNAPEDCQCTSGQLILDNIKDGHKYMVVISGDNGTHAKYYIDPLIGLEAGQNTLKTTWNTNDLSDKCKMSNISVFTSAPTGIVDGDITGGEDVAQSNAPDADATISGGQINPLLFTPLLGLIALAAGDSDSDSGVGSDQASGIASDQASGVGSGQDSGVGSGQGSGVGSGQDSGVGSGQDSNPDSGQDSNPNPSEEIPEPSSILSTLLFGGLLIGKFFSKRRTPNEN